MDDRPPTSAASLQSATPIDDHDKDLALRNPSNLPGTSPIARVPVNCIANCYDISWAAERLVRAISEALDIGSQPNSLFAISLDLQFRRARTQNESN
jgi:hypothetical protein